MTLYVFINYALFVGLLPLSIIWLRKAWKIGVRKDLSIVALKRGESPAAPKKYVTATIAANLTAGLILASVFVFVLLTGLYNHYSTWTAIAGSTIWMKFIAEFIISRQAHLKTKNNAS